MELKVSSKKRFFVRVATNIKEDLNVLIQKKNSIGKSRMYKTASIEMPLTMEENVIDNYLVDEKDSLTFSKLVKEIMIKKDLTSKDIYKNSLINRKLFSALNTNDNYLPSRETAIMYCIALKLSYEESSKLIQSAGFSFYEYSNFDIIIKYFLDNKIYNIDKINDALYTYTNKCLGYR